MPVPEEKLRWAGDMVARKVPDLTRLVNDLLDVARIAAGKISLQMERLELQRVVSQAVENSRPLILARGHDFSVYVPKGPLHVRGDAVRLAQIVSNLLNNAAKYTHVGGSIALNVSREGTQVVLRVKDNGSGIPEEMLGRIFDPFTQLDSARDRAQGGLGIGLTLVKRLVDLHGGSVEALSAGRNQGSEFIVRLPVAEPLRHQDSIDVDPPEPGGATHGGVREPTGAGRRPEYES
jgi:signal transduction histidine kinase